MKLASQKYHWRFTFDKYHWRFTFDKDDGFEDDGIFD